MIRVQNRPDFLIIVGNEMPDKPYCIELGVLHGDFSQLILMMLNPGKLILIDPYITNTGRRYGKDVDELPTAYSTEEDYQNMIIRFHDEIIFDKVRVIRKYSYEATDNVRDNSIDFIYIDACHLYDDVKKDLNDWLPKMKQDGLICGHDYIENYKLEVCRAVDEFCKEYNFEMIIFNENGGDYALKRK